MNPILSATILTIQVFQGIYASKEAEMPINPEVAIDVELTVSSLKAGQSK